MKRFTTPTLGIAAALGLTLWASACRSPHHMRENLQAKTTVCSSCYDKAVEVWTSSSDKYSGRFGYAPKVRVYQEHQCPECRTTAVVHTEEGRWMITCPKCAPEGVPCDKCQPPDGVAK